MSDFIDPTATQSVQVPELPTFKHKNEDGSVVQNVKPMAATQVETTKYYFLVTKGSSMHREDGLRIPFVNHIHETNFLHTQRFLDLQIEDGHQQLRAATEKEIQAYKMSKDPRGTVIAEITPILEAQLRDKITKEILEQMSGVSSDADKLGGTMSVADRLAALKSNTVTTGNATVVLDTTGNPGPKLQGIVSTKDINDAASGSGV